MPAAFARQAEYHVHPRRVAAPETGCANRHRNDKAADLYRPNHGVTDTHNPCFEHPQTSTQGEPLPFTSANPKAVFTEKSGLARLRAMMADRRFADPGKFAHVRQELGIDPASEGDPPENDDTAATS